MLLDLKEIIDVPGAVQPFETELDTDRLLSPGIISFLRPPFCRGRVVNTAGLLTLEGDLAVEMVCRCDRCGTEFQRKKERKLSLPLSAQEEDDGEAFPLSGDALDLEDVLGTVFLLDAETKSLCRPNCRGLCPTCGKNLNDGPCGCKKHSVDPRFAVLEQLLDIDPDA